jgi:peptide/nickel transport system substrate-binding protein
MIGIYIDWKQPIMLCMQSMTDAGGAGLNRRGFLRLAAVSGLAMSAGGLVSGCAPQVATSTVLRIGSTTDIDSLNPFTGFSSQAVDVLSLIYDKLVDYDVNFAITPSLATATERSSDGTTFTYTLREGVTWHDGKPFTAADVVFTLTMIRDNNYGTYGAYFTDLKKITAVDDTHVRLVYSVPQTLEPGVIAPIVPKHIWSKLSASELTKFGNDKPVGTGPFRDAAWTKGSLVQVARNDQWWGTKPAAATVSWAVFGNDDVLAQSLRTGAIDLVAEIPPVIFGQLEGAEKVNRAEAESFSFHMIGFNCSTQSGSKANLAVRDKTVRQALSLATSREQLVELALSGHGEPGAGLLPTAFGDYHWTPTGSQVLDNDPDRAKALLDAAGYRDRDGDGYREDAEGHKLSLRLLAIADTTVDVKAAQLFVTAAKAIGIKLTLSTTDADTMGSTVFNTDAPDWDIMVWGWDSSLYDPSYLLGIPTTEQIGGNNDTFWTSAEYDRLYKEQSRTVDKAKRIELVKQLQAIHYDACPYIVMWYQKKLSGWRTDTWTGWATIAGGPILNFTRANYLGVRPV